MRKGFNLKKRFNDMKIGARIMFIILSVNIIAIAGLLAFISYYSSNLQKETALENAQNLAYRYANQINKELEVAIDASYNLIRVFNNINFVEKEKQRDFINSLLRDALLENPNFFGVCTCWEPNAFDGLDEKYKNTQGHDKTGRFIPYFFRDGEDIKHEALLDYEVEGVGDWYLLPKKNLRETVINPFVYVAGGKEILMTSILTPIIKDGVFQGVTGVDFYLADFQKLTDSVKPYETGYITILSNNGTFVSHPKIENIGKLYSELAPEIEKEHAIVEKIQNGKLYSFTSKSLATGEYSEMFIVPIKIGNSKEFWATGVVVPMNKIMAPVYVMQRIVFILGLFSIAFLFVLIWLVSRDLSDIIKNIVSQTQKLVEAALSGNLVQRSSTQNIHREFHPIITGMNATLDALTEPLNMTANYIARISNGDIPPKITDDYKGDFNTIKNNLNQCIDSLNGLTNEMANVTKQQVAGDFEVFAEETKFEGSYKTIISGFNTGMKIHIDIIMKILDLLKDYAEGDLSKSMPVMPGKQIGVTNTLNLIRQNVLNLINDFNSLSEAAIQGKLANRADASKHHGDFRKIVEGVNNTIDAIVTPLNMTAEYVAKISIGDIPQLITDNYNGDFNTIKNNLNLLIRSTNDIIEKAKKISNGILYVKLENRSENDELMLSLNNMVQTISKIINRFIEASQSIASAGYELNQSAVQISQGSNEQAAASEQVAASMEEMSSSISQNAENSQLAGSMSTNIDNSIESINQSVKDTTAAMQKIAEKIKVVNEIAGKTDLLAINAAIEAARAGEFGKGFSVVATEIRKLAENSSKAAVQIEDITLNSVKVAEQSYLLIQNLTPEIKRTSRLVQEISATSNEQLSNANQVNNAMQQLSQVIQQNSAASEELASTSEEFVRQSDNIKKEIKFFKIEDKKGNTVNELNELLEKYTKEIRLIKLKLAEDELLFEKNKNANRTHNKNVEHKIQKTDGIELDMGLNENNDDDFAEY